MRDLGDLRSFVAGGAIALPMDFAVTPLFLFVLFLLHPVYGADRPRRRRCCSPPSRIATEFFARRPTARANAGRLGSVHSETAAAIRNAEVIAAMGMLPAVARRWRRPQARALDSIERGRARRQGACRRRQDPADRPADRHRLRRRRARHRARGVRRHHRRRRGAERAAAPALRAADRRLAAVARRLRRARAASATCWSRGAHHPLAHAGRGRSARRSSSTGSATCRRARTGPCSATSRSASRPASSSASIGPSGAGKSTLARAHRRALGADRRRHLSRRPEHLRPRARQLRRGGRLPAAGPAALRGQGPREHRPLPRRRHGRRRRRGARSPACTR